MCFACASRDECRLVLQDTATEKRAVYSWRALKRVREYCLIVWLLACAFAFAMFFSQITPTIAVLFFLVCICPSKLLSTGWSVFFQAYIALTRAMALCVQKKYIAVILIGISEVNDGCFCPCLRPLVYGYEPKSAEEKKLRAKWSKEKRQN